MSGHVASLLALALAVAVSGCSESHTTGDFDAASGLDSWAALETGPRNDTNPIGPPRDAYVFVVDTDRPPSDASGACGELFQPCCAGMCVSGLACEPSTGFCLNMTVPEDAAIGPDAIGPDSGVVMPLCGVPGAPCCAGDVCEGGACCDAAICVPSGGALASGEVCRAGIPTVCGAADEACCAGGACDMAGCCVSGTCRMEGVLCGTVTSCMAGHCESPMFTCGGDGDPCCSTGAGSAPFCTASGLVCTGGGGGATCEACGAPGQPCCAGQACGAGGCCVTDTCVAPGDSCGDMLGACAAGGCSDGACGVIGDPCCGGGIGCPGPFAVCGDVDVCVACGGDGQRCCGNTCLAGYACRGRFGMRSCIAL